MRGEPAPAAGGEKSRRLYWACRNGGLVKITPDGSLVWIFEKRPPTLFQDGSTYIDARDFRRMVADSLSIAETQVYELEDGSIRNIAGKIVGVNSTPLQAPLNARGAFDESKK